MNRNSTMNIHPYKKRTLYVSMILCLMILASCKESGGKEDPASSILNLSHLDYLSEVVSYGGEDLRIIHIYADAPDYNWVGDDDEGEACVDDAARAAVVYLRHFELTGNEESAEKAKELLRFVMYMQTEDGLFHNFVWDNSLRKNTTHKNSVANEVNWWAGRAVWALGTGARVLAEYDSSFANMSLLSVDKILPHINEVLEAYPKTKIVNGFEMPTWLIGETGSDATSELLLGLVAASKVSSNGKYDDAINKFSEGIAMLQYGDLTNAPYGAHLSWEGGWHGWGNSQTMALAEAGKLESAVIEAENFFPMLLVNGWFHSFDLQNPSNKRDFEQIAYATRAASVGMIRLYEATQNDDYAIMAGLLASWLNGNNVAETKMYNSLHGYGYDGINSENNVNKNSGAESTIEADFTVLEVEQFTLSNKWFYAKSEEPLIWIKDGKSYQYRVFTVNQNQETEKIAVLLNLTDSTSRIITETELNTLLNQN
tara:strand:+ start:17534 stop:18985 length:1452 start_codon:yes stop_codon:yes gene_type:complete